MVGCRACWGGEGEAVECRKKFGILIWGIEEDVYAMYAMRPVVGYAWGR